MGGLSQVRRYAARLFTRCWYEQQSEYFLLDALYQERARHQRELKEVSHKLERTATELATMNNFLAEMKEQLELDIPSFVEQTGWESGFYNIPDSDTSWFFNPSLIRVNADKILVARRIWNTFNHYLNEVHAFPIFNGEVGKGKRLDIPLIQHTESYEDPRAFSDGKGWYLSAVNFVQGQTFAHQVVIPLDSLQRPTRIYHPRIGKNGNSLYSNEAHEKNWNWFFHEGNPHCIYYTSPHTVYRYDWFSGPVQKWEVPIVGAIWMHGEPRGGTPPIRVGDEYWSFFHSFTGWKWPRRRYHMGAYAFQAQPPFAVTRFCTYPILSGSARDPVKDPLPLTIFPGGATFDDGMWHVVFGVNDLKCGWIKIPHSCLADLCKPLDPSSKWSYMPDQKTMTRPEIRIEDRVFA